MRSSAFTTRAFGGGWVWGVIWDTILGYKYAAPPRGSRGDWLGWICLWGQRVVGLRALISKVACG